MGGLVRIQTMEPRNGGSVQQLKTQPKPHSSFNELRPTNRITSVRHLSRRPSYVKGRSVFCSGVIDADPQGSLTADPLNLAK